ncbi:MAG: slipin family protein [Candidatus Micrarchaeota archaeon]|nr:slipin family protein [Candidatus Micrarchaeota archaeon]MDE1848347.1 slipin family protein [Candidatus Micrarchaeota archaeon]MDE1864803.1 slipin family protein [Candidatus Micrarchaeota archaeon]
MASDKGADTAGTEIKSTYSGGAALIVDVIIIILITLVAAAATNVEFISTAVAFFFALIIVLALSVRVISQWNRMAVLRFGRYVGIIGPGIYFIIPLIESTPVSLDIRVISTPFKAEKTLTKDNVPVDVDAILFWQVKNPENAILNVQSYYDSVLLASQTAMRDIIGKSELSIMLAGRDIIGKDIQDLIEERVTSWGIDAISVEIRDVTIPDDLQNAMARVATSDREKQARVILAESESLAADKMLEASRKYETDPLAMQLRALNMMYEISISGKNVMVFIPTENRGFAMPIPFGVQGIKDYIEQQQKQAKPKKGAQAGTQA